VHAERGGIVQAVDTRAIGLAVVALGGGRKRPEDEVDPAVGFSALALPGERVGDEQPLGLVHARDAASAERAAAALRAAYQLGDGEAQVAELIGQRY